MDGLNKFFHKLNTSNYFIGLMMIMLNIGSKYFIQEFGASIDFFFNLKIMRRVLIFTVFFVATRDVKTSLIMTAAFIIIALELFNEKSKMCILPQRLIDIIDTNKDGKLSNDEIQHAMRTLKKAGYVKNPK
tara:strand:+ start:109 stop:501 length:393 start_codon:yes stop_codon:yes gene_type:complete